MDFSDFFIFWRLGFFGQEIMIVTLKKKKIVNHLQNDIFWEKNFDLTFFFLKVIQI